ncbi:tRNA dihydrouridine synthase [Roseateles depolymerans]|uniref:tRNA-dihydrouridine(16) synthase n=1 Tax=Roseateles depolymerans TaxID=76731 RepID=A0A0U3E400_9BURK|nr:tRNA-dihydrouridine synthase [Roseateles depolymerans]ALV07941.1 tRNA-dihydrouridine synthase [Roseateles depolymerans]
MEGLLDHMLRDTLTQVGGVDRCVSEFIRITDQLLPRRVFTRIVPELRHASRTRAGVPVRPQLLGSDPTCLAENAARLAELHPAGIDLNFGCPAKTVNRHRGGAVLLDEPTLVHDIVAAVRRAVPAHIAVSAKMRLGNEDRSRMLECASAVERAGASELVIHARTKRDGYKPPAYWDQIAVVRQSVRVPVVANGEVWTVADARRCLAESGCDSLMLGRGMVANPGLALALRAELTGTVAPALSWTALLVLMADFFLQVRAKVAARHQAGRLKQWLHYLRRHYPEAEETYQRVRVINSADELSRQMFGDAVADEMAARLALIKAQTSPVSPMASPASSRESPNGSRHSPIEPNAAPDDALTLTA